MQFYLSARRNRCIDKIKNLINHTDYEYCTFKVSRHVAFPIYKRTLYSKGIATHCVQTKNEKLVKRIDMMIKSLNPDIIYFDIRKIKKG